MVEAQGEGAATFRFGLGSPVLEFVATLAGRRSDALERLAAPSDLSHWLERAGLARGARCDEAVLADARQLREALYRLLESARSRRTPPTDELNLINSWARQAVPAPQLDQELQLAWAVSEPCRAALAQLARSAIELVSSPDLGRVRNCANPACSLMFIDRSRPGRRRWCSMQYCGNRAKTARYRQRRTA